MDPQTFERFVGALLVSPELHELWQFGDRGMPVYAHTIDVVHLCLERFGSLRRQHGSLDLTATVVGALTHDLSKGHVGRATEMSHSRIMTHFPEIATTAAMDTVERVAGRAGINLSGFNRDLALHIVESHHGPWGRVRPQTPEAQLVYECDLYSATNHRLAPVDANDILPLLVEGYSWPQAGAALGVGRSIVKARLQEACRAETVREWIDLVPIWRRDGKVSSGTPSFSEQVQRAREVIERARSAPQTFPARVRALQESASGVELALAGGQE